MLGPTQEDGGLIANGALKIGASCYFTFSTCNLRIHDGTLVNIFFMMIIAMALGKHNYCMVSTHCINNHAKP